MTAPVVYLALEIGDASPVFFVNAAIGADRATVGESLSELEFVASADRAGLQARLIRAAETQTPFDGVASAPALFAESGAVRVEATPAGPGRMICRLTPQEVDENPGAWRRHADVVAAAPIGLGLFSPDGAAIVMNQELVRKLADLGLDAPEEATFGQISDRLCPEEAKADDPSSDGCDKKHELQGAGVRLERFIAGGWCEFRALGLPDGAVFICAIDIDQRRRLQGQVAHAQRNEAIGRLTAGVAHDFNNLLAVIMGNLELLALEAHAPRGKDLVDAALQATQRGANLTRQLLAFGRRSSLSPERLNLSGVIAQMEQLIHRTMPETIEFSVHIQPDLWAEIDRAQTETALLNLVINARDAMPAGGDLVIRADRVALDADQLLKLDLTLSPGEYVRLRVEDTGVGMLADVREQAFEPFFTTKPVGEGAGLGLSTVLGFAQQSGGDARLESKPGRGTSAEIYFPAGAPLPPAPEAVAPLRRAEEGDATGVVLVVEDSDDVRAVTVSQLTQLGYRVLAAETGEMALETLRAHPEIGLVLSDLVMPGDVQGQTLAEILRRERPELPVIFMSGYSAGAAAAGLDAEILLAKPIRLRELSAALRRAFAKD